MMTSIHMIRPTHIYSRNLVMGGGSGNVRGMGVQPSNLQMIEAGDG